MISRFQRRSRTRTRLTLVTAVVYLSAWILAPLLAEESHHIVVGEFLEVAHLHGAHEHEASTHQHDQSKHPFDEDGFDHFHASSHFHGALSPCGYHDFTSSTSGATPCSWCATAALVVSEDTRALDHDTSFATAPVYTFAPKTSPPLA